VLLISVILTPVLFRLSNERGNVDLLDQAVVAVVSSTIETIGVFLPLGVENPLFHVIWVTKIIQQVEYLQMEL
jgi:hypothetical protein